MKSLLSIASVAFCLFFTSCMGGNNSDSDDQNTSEDTTEVKLPVDTQSEITGEVSPLDSTIADTAVLDEKPVEQDNTKTKTKNKTAPAHNSPDQDEIDKMKAEKNKKKG